MSKGKVRKYSDNHALLGYTLVLQERKLKRRMRKMKMRRKKKWKKRTVENRED
jgi:hypothetical protein